MNIRLVGVFIKIQTLASVIHGMNPQCVHVCKGFVVTILLVVGFHPGLECSLNETFCGSDVYKFFLGNIRILRQLQNLSRKRKRMTQLTEEMRSLWKAIRRRHAGLFEADFIQDLDRQPYQPKMHFRVEREGWMTRGVLLAWGRTPHSQT